VLSFTAAKLLKAAKESHWAVLVAGSNGFWNYRHQSDTCHAYQILRKNGMPASRIITLAYDDIANDYSNPFPGKVFNKPDPTGKGVDVYADCKLDYTGEDVTPEAFLNVLKGDEAANKGKGTGRVLKSTAQDKVFVYFTDHGATGLVAFPSEELMADDLLATLKYMHDNTLYKRLVFYLEACESGSMFEGILPDNWEIYATTAANSSESSWATYCSPDDKVNGKSIGSCLGDEYSVNWMEDTEGAEETKGLQKQFQDVQTKTKGSHVQQFGVLSWTDEALKDYQVDVAEFSLLDRIFNKAEKCVDKLYYYFHKDKKAEKEAYLKYLQKAKESRVDSRDTKLHYLQNLHHTYRTDQTQQALGAELNYRKNVEDFFSHYAAYTGVTDVEVKGAVKNFGCLKASIKELKTSCPSLWGEYTLKYVKYFNAACEKPTFSTKDLVSIISGCKNT
jgi:legumain